MGNLCSIFHSRFKHLIQIIPSPRKAQLMDYILLGWQTSKYKLKKSDQKWFMKHYDEIIEDTGIKRSTLGRYIKEFVDEGLIVRRHALYSRTSECSEFAIRKGTYMHPSDKLLHLLKPEEKTQPVLEETSDKPTHNPSNDDLNDDIKPSECSNIAANERTDSLKMSEPYIRDLYTSSFNNISRKKTGLSVDNSDLKKLISQYETMQQWVEREIKEEISTEVKKLVLGTFFNLSFKDKLKLSSPEQVVAEYFYALTNVEYYLPEVTCFKHRNNILAKILRNKDWRTPKGFYNRFYLGLSFKEKQALKEERWQQEKAIEIKQPYLTHPLQQKDARLSEIEVLIYEKGLLIEKLTNTLFEQETEHDIDVIREQIQHHRREMESLWEQQAAMEETIASDRHLNNTPCYAYG